MTFIRGMFDMPQRKEMASFILHDNEAVCKQEIFIFDIVFFFKCQPKLSK